MLAIAHAITFGCTEMELFGGTAVDFWIRHPNTTHDLGRYHRSVGIT